MHFTGVYNEHKTGDAVDYAQATFYALENNHNGYNHEIDSCNKKGHNEVMAFF